LRYRVIYIHPIVFIDLFKYGSEKVKVINGLPEDATYIRSFLDDNSGWGKIGIVIESSSFVELKEGDPMPIHETLFEKAD
jgi:hypothetical protein